MRAAVGAMHTAPSNYSPSIAGSRQSADRWRQPALRSKRDHPGGPGWRHPHRPCPESQGRIGLYIETVALLFSTTLLSPPTEIVETSVDIRYWGGTGAGWDILVTGYPWCSGSAAGDVGGSMKSSALIPLVFLMVSCSAQAAGLSSLKGPPEPPASHFRGSCESDPDGTKFAEKACYTSYYPGEQGFRGRYRRPRCASSPQVTRDQRDVLARVYSRAPDYLQSRLCRLTQVFVIRPAPWGPVGWGFWEGPDRPPGTGVYLAIADRELRSRKSIADAENQIVDQLLGVAPAFRNRALLSARLRAEDSSDPTLTILGAIAHEMGHVLVADANADGTDIHHPRRRVSGPPRSACFEEAFLGTSWNADIFHRNMRRWVDFGDQHNNRQINPASTFNLERERSAVRLRQFAAVGNAIERVYRNREFVSVQADVAPEEDVVETYKFKVLADATPNQPIVFRLGTQEINVRDLVESGIPARKVQCLRDLGFLTSPP
jgi:hypothetical protein